MISTIDVLIEKAKSGTLTKQEAQELHAESLRELSEIKQRDPALYLSTLQSVNEALREFSDATQTILQDK